MANCVVGLVRTGKVCWTGPSPKACTWSVFRLVVNWMQKQRTKDFNQSNLNILFCLKGNLSWTQCQWLQFCASMTADNARWSRWNPDVSYIFHFSFVVGVKWSENLFMLSFSCIKSNDLAFWFECFTWWNRTVTVMKGGTLKPMVFHHIFFVL